MSMSKRDLPSEGQESDNVFARRRAEPCGMSLDQAVSEFIKLDERRQELKRDIDNVLSYLLPEAFEIRGPQNTVRLSDHNGQTLKVEFKTAFKCETNGLNVARELLGDDRFEDLFKTEYSPRLRELKVFLATKSADERIETAKEEIRKACVQVERAPYVSIDKRS